MGAGGGKWQRLLLLREGRHPKDKTWLGERAGANWSMANVSNVCIALTETKKRDSEIEQKSTSPPSSAFKVSRLEVVKRRVRAKESAGGSRVVIENKIADSSAQKACAGLPTSVMSKFEALRLRIKTKELEALGERHASV